MKAVLVSSFTLGVVSRTDVAPPLNLLYIASVLRKYGVEVHLLDLNIVEIPPQADYEETLLEHVREKVTDIDPDLVGISCLTTQHFPFMRRVAATSREVAPQAKVALAGVHATLFAEDILNNCPDIDYIILGEGEEQTAALAQRLVNHDTADLSHIQSFAWRNSSGEVVVNKRDHYIQDLDHIPFPSWDLIAFDEYYRDHSNWYNPKGHDIKISVPIMATRSCPYDCNFCSAQKTMGRGFRKRSAVNLVDEIEYHVLQHGHNYFGFVDDNLTLEKNFVLDFCNEIVKRNLDIQFESFNGYNIASIDEEIVHALTSAGCVYVILPVEHGCDEMRNKIIGKKLPREKIFDVMGWYKKYNLLTRAMFIMGFPEDTHETLSETKRMIEELKPDMANVFNLIPFPGTRVFKQCMQENLLWDDVDKETLWTGEMALNTKGGNFYIKPYNLSLEELSSWRHTFDSISAQLLASKTK